MGETVRIIITILTIIIIIIIIIVFPFITSYVFLHTEHWASIRSYLPVVVSARPSWAPGVIGPLVSAVGTVEVVSALAMVTSLALPASSPQWGQKL